MWNNYEAAIILRDLYDLGRDRPSLGGSPAWTADHPTGNPPRVLCMSLNFSDVVARQIERRRSVSPHRCPTERLQRRAPLRSLLVPIHPTCNLLHTARNCTISIGDDSQPSKDTGEAWHASAIMCFSHRRLQPLCFGIAATSSLAPDPHRETVWIACVKGTSKGCTRSRLRTYTAPAHDAPGRSRVLPAPPAGAEQAGKAGGEHVRIMGRVSLYNASLRDVPMPLHAPHVMRQVCIRETPWLAYRQKFLQSDRQASTAT